MAAASATTHRPAQPGSTRELAEKVYREHRQRLLSIAKRNSANTEDAEEALQDAFLLFIDHFDSEAGVPPLAWLTLTLKRRCWRLYRRQTAGAPRGNAEGIPDSKPLPEDAILAAEAADSARRRFARLRPNERRALSLQAFGYSYLEIVAITHWTYTKVNRSIRFGRARLRQDG